MMLLLSTIDASSGDQETQKFRYYCVHRFFFLVGLFIYLFRFLVGGGVEREG